MLEPVALALEVEEWLVGLVLGEGVGRVGVVLGGEGREGMGLGLGEGERGVSAVSSTGSRSDVVLWTGLFSAVAMLDLWMCHNCDKYVCVCAEIVINMRGPNNT